MLNPPIQMETNPLFQPTITPVKPLNKKVLILIILSAIIFVLLLASLLVTSLRQHQKINNLKPTPTGIPITPTIEVNQAVPTQYQLPLNQIDTEIKTQLEFAPPEIDQNIGQ
ncbi:MAG: hypothetical protein NTY75_01355 [Candidatus Shapirobacteria bacterium]|nr:hypothetical protein [Candidatus Shapirobacteria bacterium]